MRCEKIKCFQNKDTKVRGPSTKKKRQDGLQENTGINKTKSGSPRLEEE